MNGATELALARASAPPAIDYTDKDFASLRRALFELASLRLPEWTDRSPADIGVTLVELFAYVGDVISYYQDRLASEQFLSTAVERRTVQDLLRLVGYELRPPVASATELTLLLDEPAGDPRLVIPRGTRFETKPDPISKAAAVPFCYLGPDLTIDRAGLPVEDDKRRFDGLPVQQCRIVADEVIGVSTGEPSQRFPLAQRPVIPDSVELRVREGNSETIWTRRDHLLYYISEDLEPVNSRPDAPDFVVRYGPDAVPEGRVELGDGVYGAIPPRGATLVASYRVGGGAAGNAAPGTITEMKPKLDGISRVTNPRPAVGGADAETIDHARRFGPLAFRSGDRAVTLADFVTLARQAGGVAKVRARSTGWNRIDLFVAAEGDVFAPAPPETKQKLVAFFENRRMVGTSVRIQDPVAVPIDIAVEVWVEHHRDPGAVLAEVRTTVGEIVAYRNVDFGRPLYLSKVYEAVEALRGVAAANVSMFGRRDRLKLSTVVTGRLERLGLGDLTRTVDEIVSGAVPTYGRIEIGEFEIPVAGTITVTQAEGAGPSGSS